jgi:hypothetical protein
MANAAKDPPRLGRDLAGANRSDAVGQQGGSDRLTFIAAQFCSVKNERNLTFTALSSKRPDTVA